jgi:hypothetical protein
MPASTKKQLYCVAMNRIRVGFVVSLLMLVTIPRVSLAQSDCYATIAAVETAVRIAIQNENQAIAGGIDTSEAPCTTLRFIVHFVVEKSGKISKIRVGRIKCTNCNQKDKDHFSRRTVQLISAISDIVPCTQKLAFNLPITYLLYK